MEYYIKYAVIPFNFILATLVSLITFIVYKRISLIFKKDFFSAGKTKVLVICDSFKGTLSSKEVGEIIVENINKDKYTAEYLPISNIINNSFLFHNHYLHNIKSHPYLHRGDKKTY